jgi:hypothetical protein
MIPDPKRKCHLTGFAKSCGKLVSSGACCRWTQLLGQNSQTGEQMSRWGCVDDFVPQLLLEVAQQTRHTTASIDKMRHETQQRGDAQREALVDAVGMVGQLPQRATPLLPSN